MVLTVVLLPVLGPQIAALGFGIEEMSAIGPFVWIPWWLLFGEVGAAAREIGARHPEIGPRALLGAYRCLAGALMAGMLLVTLAAILGDREVLPLLWFFGLQTVILSFRLPALVAMWIAPDCRQGTPGIGPAMVEGA